MVCGKSLVNIRYPEDIRTAALGEDAFCFVIDKISGSLPSRFFDIELKIFPGLEHPGRIGNGTGSNGSI